MRSRWFLRCDNVLVTGHAERGVGCGGAVILGQKAIQVERVEDKGIQPPFRPVLLLEFKWAAIALSTAIDDIHLLLLLLLLLQLVSFLHVDCAPLDHNHSLAYLEKFHPQRWVPIQCINKMIWIGSCSIFTRTLQVSCVCHVSRGCIC